MRKRHERRIRVPVNLPTAISIALGAPLLPGDFKCTVVDLRNPARDAVETSLIKIEREAQDALDTYISSVCDPAILAALRAPRDAAREALKNYRNRSV